ncbi:MAG: hypothetical protein RBQ97_07810 [Acholeplasma sp.]|nr:hypothetical protein [Acholeplasma sp.]
MKFKKGFIVYKVNENGSLTVFGFLNRINGKKKWFRHLRAQHKCRFLYSSSDIESFDKACMHTINKKNMTNSQKWEK